MRKKNIMLLIIMLAIGFAAVSTSIYLNGTANIGTNTSDYEVIFIEALVDGLESSNVSISGDKKTITFNSNKLTNVGDKSILDYKVKNNSTQYGADVIINCTIDESEYIKITNEFGGNTIPLSNPIEMEAQEIKNGRITAELIKGYTGEEGKVNIKCEIVAGATEKEEITEYIPYRYREEILNGTDPILGEGLIPITIDNNGEVTYADISKQWYSYQNKMWANAVILEDGQNYNVGEVIPEDAIESYFVWIPKYKYKLWNVSSTKDVTNIGKHSIEIEFGTENTIEQDGVSCVTPMTSGESGSCTNGEYMTHPAFISMNTNGLWVGKYETGYKGANTTGEAQVNESDSTKVIVKPNTYSWRYNTVSNMFTAAYNYKRELDSHMMKNTEWGVVAYLSHSKYGIDKEININNNSSFKTGYSGLSTLDQSSFPGTSGDGATFNQLYNTEVGYLASTTGNITGVYDMSGGALEYMSSHISENLKDSGFTAIAVASYNAKYFDIYNTASAVQTYQYRILGDATGEMGPFKNYADKDGKSRYHNDWYADSSYFVDSGNPWFYRGGGYYDGVLAGQFYFGMYNGSVLTALGSRLVLTGQSS